MTEAANPASSDSSLRVDRVNLAVDADVAQWTRVRNEVGVALLGGDAQLTSVEIVRAMAQRSDQVRELYLARDAGQVVGAGSFLLPGGPGDTDAEVWVGVLPEGRRGGVGSAVVAAMEARARELGCSRVVLDQTSPREDGLPGSQFCVAMGCRQSQLVLGLRLDLPVPAGTLTPLQERATSASDAAYEILTAWDEIPADWLDDRAHLASELSTEAPDAAIDRATGQLVAFSDLVAYASMPHVASQSDTVVLDEHRGHRLGLAVKLANLRTLAEELPDITAVRTWTAIDNTHMLAINRELGFRVVEWTRMWVKDL